MIRGSKNSGGETGVGRRWLQADAGAGADADAGALLKEGQTNLEKPGGRVLLREPVAYRVEMRLGGRVVLLSRRFR